MSSVDRELALSLGHAARLASMTAPGSLVLAGTVDTALMSPCYATRSMRSTTTSRG